MRACLLSVIQKLNSRWGKVDARTYKFREVLKAVEHVEPMVIDGSCGHGVVTQIQGFAHLH